MNQKTMTSIFRKVNNGLVAAALVLGMLFPTAAFAQGSVSFSVSPTIFDMTATPGQTWKSSVRIINANPFELKVYIDLTNFIPKGESGVPQFLPIVKDDATQDTFAEWITTEPEVVIPPEQTIELPLSIVVPPDAAPGGHFAAIMISTRPPEDNGGQTKVETSQVITSLIFLRVSGDVNESSTIRSLRTTDYIMSRPDATFELRIENKGNVHVQPQGEIKIFNMWGQERGTIPVNQQTLFGNVLPNSVRKYSFTWSSEWVISDIGRYTAIATLAYGLDTRQFMTADTSFWVVPWKILLTILGIVVGFIWLISWSIKLYVRRMLSMAGVTPGQAPLVPGKPQRQFSVVAPIGAGILDLRSRLKETDTVKTSVRTIFTFVRSYWIFFAVVVAIIIFASLVVWFVKGAATPIRDYEVTVEESGHSFKVSSDENTEPASEEGAPPAVQAPETFATSTTNINIINRSGDERVSVRTKSNLERAGYTIANVSNDLGTIEGKTVIVYDPSDAEIALELSTLLDNALLSAFTYEEGKKEIVVYLGTDAVDAD